MGFHALSPDDMCGTMCPPVSPVQSQGSMCVPGGSMSPMSSSPWLTLSPCTTLRCHMHVTAMSKSPCMFREGTSAPAYVPQGVPYPSPMSHASPVATSVPPPCPEVPHGCHRHIRAVSVSSHGSLVWGFHGEVAQGLRVEGLKRQVWGLRGVPKEEGGAGFGGLGGVWVPGQVWGFGRIRRFKGVPKGEGRVWGWFGLPGAGL